MMNSERIAIAVICAFSILVGFGMVIKSPTRNRQPSKTNQMVLNTNSVPNISETNFLTISNRVWLQLGGAAIVRVDEPEWRILTNAYRTNLTTNAIVFWRRM